MTDNDRAEIPTLAVFSSTIHRRRLPFPFRVRPENEQLFPRQQRRSAGSNLLFKRLITARSACLPTNLLSLVLPLFSLGRLAWKT